jgi:hypothetical protein
MINIASLINEECSELAALLIAKNKDYNNTAIYPLSFLSNISPQERLKVRIDDKLTRLMHLFKNPNPNFESLDDNITDACGYLLLLKLIRRLEKEGKLVP